MREKFEAWVLGQNVCKKYGAKLTQNPDGSYRDYRINDRWNAYKASCRNPPEEIEQALLFVLFHHQGGKSYIGQAIREYLGIPQFADMTDEQIHRAKQIGCYVLPVGKVAVIPAHEILKGIDKTEIESEEGWWETSAGAHFGSYKLAQLIHCLSEAGISVDEGDSHD